METLTINNDSILIEGLALVKKSGYGTYSLGVWVRNESNGEGDFLSEETHDSELWDEYQYLLNSDQYNFLFDKCNFKISRMIEDWYSSL